MLLSLIVNCHLKIKNKRQGLSHFLKNIICLFLSSLFFFHLFAISFSLFIPCLSMLFFLLSLCISKYLFSVSFFHPNSFFTYSPSLSLYLFVPYLTILFFLLSLCISKYLFLSLLFPHLSLFLSLSLSLMNPSIKAECRKWKWKQKPKNFDCHLGIVTINFPSLAVVRWRAGRKPKSPHERKNHVFK